MHAEWVSVGAETCEAIERTRAAGGRVVSIGTTVARALESAAVGSPARREEGAGLPPSARHEEVAISPPRREEAHKESREAPRAATRLSSTPLEPYSGDTRLFISPGFKFRVVDALLTNFHLPESTLLMLVSAFAGREKVLAAYEHAVRAKYRFFSYGDAMFVTPGS